MLSRSSTFRQFLREARASFRRNGLMTAAAVTTVTVALLTVGFAVAGGLNLSHLAATLNTQVEIVAFLRDGMRPADVTRIHAALAATPGVAEVRFVPRAEALARLERRLGESPAFADLAQHNPLPDSFDVRVQEARLAGTVAGAIQGQPGVEDVTYAAQVVDRLVAVTRVMRVMAVLLTLVLSAVAVIVVTNTLRLTVIARWREIEIMELVGATRWFIRWPFLIEGMLQGLVAAVAAGATLLLLYAVAAARLRSGLPFLPIVPAADVAGPLLIAVVGCGVALGAAGSFVAVRRFLST
jgi:cell division transport system permease protein